MYNPIIGVSAPGREPASTPQNIMERADRLKEAYEELKTDLMEEVGVLDSKIIKPAMDAKVRPL
jgi:hypothetical protein